MVQLMITSSISSSASVGGDSYSSLNHSYETLNMSDTGGDVAAAAGVGALVCVCVAVGPVDDAAAVFVVGREALLEIGEPVDT